MTRSNTEEPLNLEERVKDISTTRQCSVVSHLCFRSQTSVQCIRYHATCHGDGRARASVCCTGVMMSLRWRGTHGIPSSTSHPPPSHRRRLARTFPHAPLYRYWCQHCVSGRAASTQHRRVHLGEDQVEIAMFAADCFPRNAACGDSIPVSVMRDGATRLRKLCCRQSGSLFFWSAE